MLPLQRLPSHSDFVVVTIWQPTLTHWFTLTGWIFSRIRVASFLMLTMKTSKNKKYFKPLLWSIVLVDIFPLPKLGKMQWIKSRQQLNWQQAHPLLNTSDGNFWIFSCFLPVFLLILSMPNITSEFPSTPVIAKTIVGFRSKWILFNQVLTLIVY